MIGPQEISCGKTGGVVAKMLEGCWNFFSKNNYFSLVSIGLNWRLSNVIGKSIFLSLRCVTTIITAMQCAYCSLTRHSLRNPNDFLKFFIHLNYYGPWYSIQWSYPLNEHFNAMSKVLELFLISWRRHVNLD